ncbi:hypothetical protein TRFO_06942 [Tritrichomonas foetus]|uniref:Uncharacterized protein n=1 Tax=Tritrichomonas foetus TaxID=1144522 RepID=A0A1J4JWQ6_9EUKA|nr:hypothetical protein TRFO_06942 [Tritrichomonas foetus]|eukprot:OHT02888.1 hypothetical protein TRFO_06942 [Tritrichomonas foetus]
MWRPSFSAQSQQNNNHTYHQNNQNNNYMAEFANLMKSPTRDHEAEREIKDLREKVSKLEKEVAALTNEKNKGLAKISLLESDLQSKNKTASEQKQIIENKDKVLNKIDKEKFNLQQENEKQKNDIANKNNEISALQKDIKSKNDEINKLKEQLHDLQYENRKQKNDISKQSNQISQLERDNNMIKKVLEDEKNKYLNLKDLKLRLESEFTDLKTKYEQQSKENSSYLYCIEITNRILNQIHHIYGNIQLTDIPDLNKYEQILKNSQSQNNPRKTFSQEFNEIIGNLKKQLHEFLGLKTKNVQIQQIQHSLQDFSKDFEKVKLINPDFIYQQQNNRSNSQNQSKELRKFNHEELSKLLEIDFLSIKNLERAQEFLKSCLSILDTSKVEIQKEIVADNQFYDKFQNITDNFGDHLMTANKHFTSIKNATDKYEPDLKQIHTFLCECQNTPSHILSEFSNNINKAIQEKDAALQNIFSMIYELSQMIGTECNCNEAERNSPEQAQRIKDAILESAEKLANKDVGIEILANSLSTLNDSWNKHKSLCDEKFKLESKPMNNEVSIENISDNISQINDFVSLLPIHKEDFGENIKRNTILNSEAHVNKNNTITQSMSDIEGKTNTLIELSNELKDKKHELEKLMNESSSSIQKIESLELLSRNQTRLLMDDEEKWLQMIERD